MFLSSVEILGFKSFPHRTKIEFASGLTGVVGPNGCGKTNVLDAIRWVLGEQRTSVLRGGKMEDVIFSGTREVKPLGMAEVSLTMINNDNRLPTEYSSVTVTRRLYRSGESEYLLNKTACRLKDITELFADTGMGANAYSAIELAMVEAILSDKADQRRQLFEEAAGITKYKIRKRAALRKLEATEQDLLRLNDILAEVTSQVNSLRRQMNKAERYKTLSDRVEHIELVLLKDEFRRLSAELGQVREEKRNAEIKLAQAQAEIDKWELLREDAESKITEVSDELHQLRVRLEAASEKYHTLNNELAVSLEKIKSAQAADQNDEQELAGIARKTRQLQEELKCARETQGTLRTKLQELEQEEQQRAQELSEQLENLQNARRESQDAQRDLFAIEGQESVFQHSEKQLTEQIAKLNVEHEQLSRKHSQAADEAAAIESELIDLQARSAALQSTRSDLENAHNRANAENVKAGAQLEQRMAQVAEAILEFKSTEARVNMTEDMLASYEGYGSGVGALLAQPEANSGLYDTVANLLTVEPTYAAAIEAALGEAAQYVVAADRNAAEAAIDYLRENELGGVTFLLLNKLPDNGIHNDTTSSDDGGVLARAKDIVSATPEFQPLIDLLLGDLAVVADRRTARRITVEQGVPTVTTTGEVSGAAHALSGGGSHVAQLVGREARLRALREKLQWAEVELARLRHEKALDEQHAARTAQERNNLAEKLQQLDRERSEIDVTHSKAELRLRHAGERRDELAAELQKCNEEKSTTAGELEQLRAEHARLSGDTDGRRTELVSHEEKVAASEREAERLTRLQEEVRSHLIKTRTELNSLESNVDRSEQLLNDLANEAERRKQDRINRESEVAQLEVRVTEIRTELEQIGATQEDLRSEERALDEKQQNLSMTQAEQGELLKAARRERESERNSHESLLVRETELKSRYEETHRQLRQSYNLEPDRMELPQPLAEETAAEMRSELEENREKRAQIGMVNMLALEEFERESQRQEFLQKQIDDLTQAKDNLRATITRINGTARKLFIETFDQVRSNFQQLFVELFQGGDADIKMVDPDDPLESPILISARPRGKRLLTISQLSGGEKALTAISLLFAIYLVKPSPFCILDEVDAPLDDANVGRFLKMVRTFSENTQFVVITHNKRTMEQCSRLYGVTMQQAGISQIVSVDFEKLGREFVPQSMTYEQAEAAAVEIEPEPVPPPSPQPEPEPEVAEVSSEPTDEEK